MSLFLRVELAGPPRGKGRGRAVSTPKGARIYTDFKTRTYESQLRYAAQQEMAGRPPTIQPVRVTLVARFQIAESWPRKKKLAAQLGHIRPCTTPDADNLLKCLDSLNGVVWHDDKQIVDAAVHKVYSDQPGLTIDVKTIGAPALPAVSTVDGPTADLFAADADG